MEAGWISVSVSEFYTVEAEPGKEVTLQCSNFSSLPTYIYWLKLDTPTASCIAYMISSDSGTLLCDGFKNGKFHMTSNTTTLFLNIKSVDLSDSGLYVCGPDNKGSIIVSATYLKVQGMFDIYANLTAVILGGITILLLMIIISLVVKIWKFHTAQEGGQNSQHSENLNSDALNYAAVSFHPKGKSSRRPAPVRELELNVVYATTIVVYHIR
ncbi:uncharacterized protein LOC114451176 [Parambassis ranga]|uniref:Uncharacterized protein LOC114451176 n=1 Tax=Parambassis ranga TaxID=210632 RepID=A0A6P7K7X5_9TELE|nr:uncharacterized protein LOC114451176 [Parambassis ranga]